MSASKPGEMYKLNPYYDSKGNVDIPECMYKMKNIYTAAGSSPEASSDSVDPALAALATRQDAILQRLTQLQEEVERLKQSRDTSAHSTVTAATQSLTHNVPSSLQDIVVNADPSQPPLAVLILRELLAAQCKVLASSHIHSSVRDVPQALRDAFCGGGDAINRSSYNLILTLIWKAEPYGCSMMVTPNTQTRVCGEANIARYLARLLTPAYDAGDIVTATEIDTLVDLRTPLATGNNKEKSAALRTLNARLGKNTWLVGGSLSLADIVLWAAIQQTKQAEAAPTNVKKWIDSCNAHPAFKSALHCIASC